uniref:Glycosyltransferase n=1 Tax=Muscari armeniacum TaxID=156613 RepID=A0A649UB03_MUSAR|nr:UDP-glucose:flavonoid 3-O-glucosyltransferase [Muscari armeniacum]
MSATHDKPCRPHIAVVAFPMGSHVHTLFTIAKALALAAPAATVSFITSASSVASPPPSPIANLRLVPALEVSSAGTPGEQLSKFVRAMPGNLRAGLEEAVSREDGLRVSCIVSDGMMPELGEVAREMGAVWVVDGCAPVMAVSLLHAYELREAFGSAVDDARGITPKPLCFNSSNCNLLSFSEELVSFVPSLSSLRVRDIPDFIFPPTHDHLIAGTIKEYPKAAAVVFNTFQGLEPLIDADLTSMLTKYLPIGPTKLLTPRAETEAEADRLCIPWLDRQRAASVVYVSFGTFNAPSQRGLVELARGLEASGHPYLWSIKPEMLPKGFVVGGGGRGLVVDWAPQERVLGHPAVGAFLTHCGWNSVMEGISGGVPMVCWPFRWDQMANARTVSRVHGIGVTLEEGGDVAEGGIAKALKTVMEEEEGAAMRARVKMLKARAEEAVAPGGSSSENFKTLLDIVCG